MRYLLLLAAFIVCCPAAAEAQELPRTEVFAGYSHLGLDGGGGSRDHLNGFEASVAGYVNKYFGVVGDVSGHYDSRDAETCTPPAGGACFPPPERKASLYNFLGGVQLKARGQRLAPFARALVGGSRLKVEVGALRPVCAPGSGVVCINAPPFTIRESSFSFAVGGGLDLKVGGRVSLRLIQAEYLRTGFASSRQDNVRVAAGIVF